MAILSLIFKRAWQAQFLRHALVHKTKNVYFFKMYKWYYYHILIFLMVSNLEKSHKSFLSRVQSSLSLVYLFNNRIGNSALQSVSFINQSIQIVFCIIPYSHPKWFWRKNLPVVSIVFALVCFLCCKIWSSRSNLCVFVNFLFFFRCGDALSN